MKTLKDSFGFIERADMVKDVSSVCVCVCTCICVCLSLYMHVCIILIAKLLKFDTYSLVPWPPSPFVGTNLHVWCVSKWNPRRIV